VQSSKEDPTMMRSQVFALGVSLALLAACGEESKAPAPAPSGTPAAGGAAPAAKPAGGGGAYDPASATATVKVKATMKGDAIPMRPIKFDQDEKCKGLHSSPVPEETVVCKDGHLANVIVYVSRGAEGRSYATPTTPVVLDQKGCMYHPHVFTVMVNQPLSVKTSDDTSHNVHVAPKVNEDWNKSQLAGAADLSHMLDKPELPVRIKCDIHGWMLSWAGVFDHPFHAVTGEDGTATLKLPPGDYEISAWHEYDKFGKPAAQKVTVAGTDAKELEFVFEKK
jgi:hypothetical protein